MSDILVHDCCLDNTLGKCYKSTSGNTTIVNMTVDYGNPMVSPCKEFFQAYCATSQITSDACRAWISQTVAAGDSSADAVITSHCKANPHARECACVSFMDTPRAETLRQKLDGKMPIQCVYTPCKPGSGTLRTSALYSQDNCYSAKCDISDNSFEGNDIKVSISNECGFRGDDTVSHNVITPSSDSTPSGSNVWESFETTVRNIETDIEHWFEKL